MSERDLLEDAKSIINATVVPMCGNCRYHQIDEHGGGRNKCRVQAESLRYYYTINHTCDTFTGAGWQSFEPNYWRLDGILVTLRELFAAYEDTGRNQ